MIVSEDPATDPVVEETRRWLERAVIGLNLCPFANAVHVGGRIRWAVSDARDARGLRDDLVGELESLVAADEAKTETTLLIHPQALLDFGEYNDFLDLADEALAELALTDVIQVASFHPDYQFGGTDPDDIENCTNRSPYPMLHLLRQSSVERAVSSMPDTNRIFEKNIETMEKLGWEGWRRVLGKG